jgi:ADP-heptose:LPS heptosyltransferase
MSKILIIRFSALGDVAMTIPVVYSFAAKYPEHTITILSEAGLKPMFETAPENVLFLGADLKDKHDGLFGLRKLYKELKHEEFDYVADFHSVIRSYFLRLLFKFDGIPTAHIDKGRSEKTNLTRKNNKTFVQLKSTFVRYQQVLQKLGFEFDLNFETILKSKDVDFSPILSQIGEKGVTKWIGIAPFAKHKGKIYPLELQEKVIEHFANDKRVKVIVFGGGKEEKEIIKGWIKKYPAVQTMVGKLNLSQEILLMSQLDLMYSMDSANMHLASLVNTTVVSLWGATHPYAGFMGWKQSEDNAVQVDLSCRPCSIYGNKECYRKDYACLNQINPEAVIRLIERILY